MIGLALGLRVPGASGLFLPSQIPNLAQWYRSDQGIALDGSNNVQQWNDISGNGITLTQGTPANRPSFVASTSLLGNRPALHFNPSGSVNLGASSGSVSQPNTTYIAFNSQTSVIQNFLDGGGARQLMQDGTSGIWNMYAGTSVSTSAGTTTGAHAIAMVFNGASSKFYDNNSSTNILTASSPGSNGISSLLIGDTSSSPSNAYIAEVIIYSGAHTSAQIASVFGYLASLYSIPAS